MIPHTLVWVLMVCSLQCCRCPHVWEGALHPSCAEVFWLQQQHWHWPITIRCLRKQTAHPLSSTSRRYSSNPHWPSHSESVWWEILHSYFAEPRLVNLGCGSVSEPTNEPIRDRVCEQPRGLFPAVCGSYAKNGPSWSEIGVWRRN